MRRTYINQERLALMLGVSRRLVAKRWAGDGGLFPPEVRVGPVLGWSAERGREFGIAAGLLTAQGALIPRDRYTRVVDPAGDWKVETVAFTGLTDIARLWGRGVLEIIRLRKADGFPASDVEILGVNGHDVYGWYRSAILRAGQQTGKLDEDFQPVPAVRTRPAQQQQQA